MNEITESKMKWREKKLRSIEQLYEMIEQSKDEIEKRLVIEKWFDETFSPIISDRPDSTGGQQFGWRM